MNKLIKVGAKVTNFDEAVDKKIILSGHPYAEPYILTAHDNDRLILINKEGKKELGTIINEDNMFWCYYEEPKKKVMLYPALMRTNGSFPHYYMTDTLYEKELGDSVDGFVRLVKELGIEVEQ